MQYRTLGKTGLEVSILGLGTSSLGGVFRSVEESAAIRTVRVALDAGINFLDSSPFYGLTKSETVLGKALKGVPRDRYILATKAGRYGYEMADFDFSAARLTASVDESLARLGVDFVDLIQLHDMEFGDLDQIVGEAVPALRRVQEQGKARFVGITALPLCALHYVFERVEVDTIQTYCHYCLNDTALADAVPSLERARLGVISSAPLAMRLLTNVGPPEWHPAPAPVREKCAEAARFCETNGKDIARLALQFSVGNPALHTTLVSTANPDRIASNVRHIEEPPDPELLEQVLQILAPIHNQTWPQGRPENNAIDTQ